MSMADSKDIAERDSDRIDWIQAHPCNIKWNHERGWIVQFGVVGEGEGKTLRLALDDAMLKAQMGGVYKLPAAPYGYCPHCGLPGYTRERRPNGNDRCEGGHVYPASAAVQKLGTDRGA